MQFQYSFVFLVAVARCLYAQRPVLVLQLSATNVTAGDQLTANCTAQSITAGRVLHIDGQPAAERIADRLSISSMGTTTTWIIDPVQTEDAGEYSCFSGGDQASHLDSAPQTVTVYVPQRPVLVLELSATNITVGEQLTAICTAQTITAIRVLYISGESVVQRISADRLSSNSSRMTTTWIIDPVRSEDEGEYYCFAGGDQGTHLDSPKLNVTVYISPLDSPTQNVTVYILPNASNLTPPGPTEICPEECRDCELENPTCCSSCADGLTLSSCMCAEEGGQALAVYQLAGFGVSPTLFVLLLLILTVLLVYVLRAKKRAVKTTALV